MLLPKEKKKGGKFRYQKIEKGTEKMRNLLLLLLPETWEEGAAVFSNTLTGMFLWLWCEEEDAEIIAEQCGNSLKKEKTRHEEIMNHAHPFVF